MGRSSFFFFVCLFFSLIFSFYSLFFSFISFVLLSNVIDFSIQKPYEICYLVCILRLFVATASSQVAANLEPVMHVFDISLHTLLLTLFGFVIRWNYGAVCVCAFFRLFLLVRSHFDVFFFFFNFLLK